MRMCHTTKNKSATLFFAAEIKSHSPVRACCVSSCRQTRDQSDIVTNCSCQKRGCSPGAQSRERLSYDQCRRHHRWGAPGSWCTAAFTGALPIEITKRQNAQQTHSQSDHERTTAPPAPPRKSGIVSEEMWRRVSGLWLYLCWQEDCVNKRTRHQQRWEAQGLGPAHHQLMKETSDGALMVACSCVLGKQ